MFRLRGLVEKRQKIGAFFAIANSLERHRVPWNKMLRIFDPVVEDGVVPHYFGGAQGPGVTRKAVKASGLAVPKSCAKLGPVMLRLGCNA